jgi:hypothetical protein
LLSNLQAAERLFGLAQTMFQFLDQLRKPSRCYGIVCSFRESTAHFELPLKLLPVKLVIHDDTLLSETTVE